MYITHHSYATMDPASALEFLFKRRRFLAHDLAFFIQRHVSDLIQRIVHIRIVIRIGERTPVCKEHVHDRHGFAHGIRFANRIRFHVNEVFFVMIVWIRIMLVNGLAGDPRTHEPTRVSERPEFVRSALPNSSRRVRCTHMGHRRLSVRSDSRRNRQMGANVL